MAVPHFRAESTRGRNERSPEWNKRTRGRNYSILIKFASTNKHHPNVRELGREDNRTCRWDNIFL